MNVLFKDKRDEYEVGSEEYKFYDAMQLTQKVLLNSFYGVLGLKTFRFMI
jgi:DNA polymerase elongation subunit (family B)